MVTWTGQKPASLILKLRVGTNRHVPLLPMVDGLGPRRLVGFVAELAGGERAADVPQGLVGRQHDSPIGIVERRDERRPAFQVADLADHLWPSEPGVARARAGHRPQPGEQLAAFGRLGRGDSRHQVVDVGQGRGEGGVVRLEQHLDQLRRRQVGLLRNDLPAANANLLGIGRQAAARQPGPLAVALGALDRLLRRAEQKQRAKRRVDRVEAFGVPSNCRRLAAASSQVA